MAHTIQEYKKSCFTCQGFCWWDGDYCCTLRMKILQHAPSKNSWLREEILDRVEKNCKDYMEDPGEGFLPELKRLLELERLYWEYLRQAQGVSLISHS